MKVASLLCIPAGLVGGTTGALLGGRLFGLGVSFLGATAIGLASGCLTCAVTFALRGLVK
jgi:hypothetical protein